MRLYLTILFVQLMLIMPSINAAPEMPDTSQFVELTKTNTMIEFDLQFASSKTPLHFKVQDGAMNIISTDGQSPIRFIVKVEAKDDIRYRPVESQTFKMPDGDYPGLAIQEGVSK